MTYERFEELTRDEVLALVEKIGNGTREDPLEDNQNDSPTMRELLNAYVDDEATVLYGGYIIHKPRSDYRVTVEEVNFKDLDISQLVHYLTTWGRSADEVSVEGSGRFDVRLWWD